MRILFTFLISCLAFTHLDAQQLTNGASAPAEQVQIRIYPNPVYDELRLSGNDKMDGHSIRVFNLLGSEMINQSIENAQEAIDISALSPGLYLYNITDKNDRNILSGKFNKQ